MTRPHYLLLAAAAVALCACAESPQKVVFQAKIGLVGGETLALACVQTRLGYCSTQEHVDTVVHAKDTARTAVNSAERIVRDQAAPKGALAQAATAALAAVSALLALVPPTTMPMR